MLDRPLHRSLAVGRVLALGASVALLGACAGENLFLGPGLTNTGPDVTITAPTEGTEVPLGASLQVTAGASSRNGLVTATYKGIFADSGASAFVLASQDLGNRANVSLNTTLNATVGAGLGEVLIIVDVTDLDGQIAADTVSITIN
jgi:hypothetical protein